MSLVGFCLGVVVRGFVLWGLGDEGKEVRLSDAGCALRV